MLVKVTYQIIFNVNILCYIPVGWSPFGHSDLLSLMRIYECSHGFILCYINWNQMCLKIHMYVCIYPYILKEKKKNKQTNIWRFNTKTTTKSETAILPLNWNVFA